MTELETAILKDEILNALVSGEKDCQILTSELQNEFDLVWSLTEQISKDGFLKERKYQTKNGTGKALQITPAGKTFLKSSSYSSSLNSENESQKKTQRRRTTMELIKIGITIIFGVSTAILGWLSFSRDQTIKEQQNEINLLKNQIDSLKKGS